MNNKIKKGLIIATGIATSALLIFLITRDIQIEPDIEETMSSVSSEDSESSVVIPPIELESQESSETEFTVSEESELSEEERNVVEQSIQPEPESKPEITEEEQSDPTQTPDGEPVEVPTPSTPNPPQTETPTTQPSEPENSGGLPGFGEVIDGGENTVVKGESDGDINTQIGDMG